VFEEIKVVNFSGNLDFPANILKQLMTQIGKSFPKLKVIKADHIQVPVDNYFKALGMAFMETKFSSLQDFSIKDVDL
jgi:hypothetical protein